ncbi:MAG: hypothetical protein QXG10_05380 [Candidatus Hadarchaeales archaeon]
MKKRGEREFIKPIEGHDYELESRIFEAYRKIRKEQKQICEDCSKNAKILNGGHPVSFFGVGENFRQERYRVLFVGKTVQSGWEEDWKDGLRDEASGFIDARERGRNLFLPFFGAYNWQFWQCIKEVSRKLFETNDPDELWKKIAITNIVKCSTSEGRDTTPVELKENCVSKAKFFQEEVKIIEPTHIIFFTGLDYDDYIKEIDFGCEYNGKKDNKGYQFLGEAKVLWWHRTFLKEGRPKINFLRTNHPAHPMFRDAEVAEEFTTKIADWIRQNPVF